MTVLLRLCEYVDSLNISDDTKSDFKRRLNLGMARLLIPNKTHPDTACVAVVDDYKLLPQFKKVLEEINPLIGDAGVRHISDVMLQKIADEECTRFEEPARRKAVANAFIGVLDYGEVARSFMNLQPLLYNEARIWFRWDIKKFAFEICDEITIMAALDDVVRDMRTFTSSTKSAIIEALRREARRKWLSVDRRQRFVQFGSTVVDIETGAMCVAHPGLFILNPVPHELGKTDDTPIIDGLLNAWLPGNAEALLEILAYILWPKYQIHRIFVLIGRGANGKSTYLRLIQRMVGQYNCTTTTVESLVGDRFDTARLFGKSVCILGETNYRAIKSTDLLKRLSGQDMVAGQFKMRDAFEFVNHAKIIIATNSLPETHDRTYGFYRRWIIIDFSQQFSESGADPLDVIPEQEYENLCRKCLGIVAQTIARGKFITDLDSDEKERQYESHSNPLTIFIAERCAKAPASSVVFSDFYDAYAIWANERGHRVETKEGIGAKLTRIGFEKSRKQITTGDDSYKVTVYHGLNLTGHGGQGIHDISISNTYVRDQLENGCNPVHRVQIKQESLIIHQKCAVCGAPSSAGFDGGGVPCCADCLRIGGGNVG